MFDKIRSRRFSLSFFFLSIFFSGLAGRSRFHVVFLGHLQRGGLATCRDEQGFLLEYSSLYSTF